MDRDTIEKVKSKQGILSKIQNFFSLGYGTKEDLRELDKKLRDIYYMDLRDMRHVWEDIYLELLDSGMEVPVNDLKKVIQVLDRVIEKVNHADYGYAGLMDRKGYIREEELSRVFNYDNKLSEDVEGLKKAIEKTRKNLDIKNWEDVSKDVKNVKGLLLTLENKWQSRDKQFRPLE